VFNTALKAAANDMDSNAEGCRKFCWISYLDFQEYLMDKDESEFTRAVYLMYEKLISYGIDTVVVQVRPMGDAIYPSEYFPVSAYISSTGELPDYDPLLIMVNTAHEMGLSFEAWINPYRLSRSNETTEHFKQQTEYYEKYNAFIYEYKNENGETCLSLEPSDQRSIELIVSGVEEIIRGYDVDGIHFDDYFYVSGMHDGASDFEDEISTEEKMQYINSMISQVYEAVKAIDPECTFGVSPAGNLEAAKEQGADIERWLSTPGYVDYIMPQIYWTDYYVSDEETVTMFTDMARSWQDVNELGLPIYVGLALYRVGEVSETDKGWSLYSDNLAKSWQTALELGYDGYALFRYAWFDYESAAAELENLKQVSLSGNSSETDTGVKRIKKLIDDITELAKKYLQ
jgi:uncharacterized lipoprotein YddW (UPF0748 family)